MRRGAIVGVDCIGRGIIGIENVELALNYSPIIDQPSEALAKASNPVGGEVSTSPDSVPGWTDRGLEEDAAENDLVNGVSGSRIYCKSTTESSYSISENSVSLKRR